MRSKIKEARPQEYFQWLCDLVQINDPDNSYFLLANFLFNRPFTWSVPMDANRSEDGMQLREEFEYDTNYRAFHVDDIPCTMLEMLIGLSTRIDGIMQSETHEDISRWFWELLGNLEMDIFNDDDYYELGGEGELDKKLRRFLERKYKKNGEGGLFPLSDYKRLGFSDQRLTQIWYQMQAYLNEKYPV